MLVGDADVFPAGPPDVSRAREKAAAGALPDPGSEEALRGHEHPRLLVDLADGAGGEALAGGEPPRRGLPGLGAGTLKQEHATVGADGQDARDEIGLHCQALEPLFQDRA
jgi:hypothetical protein